MARAGGAAGFIDQVSDISTAAVALSSMAGSPLGLTWWVGFHQLMSQKNSASVPELLEEDRPVVPSRPVRDPPPCLPYRLAWAV